MRLFFIQATSKSVQTIGWTILKISFNELCCEKKTSSWSLQICFFSSVSVFQSYQWIREAKERAVLSRRMRRGWGTRTSLSSVLFKTQHNAKTEFNHYCNEWTFFAHRTSSTGWPMRRWSVFMKLSRNLITTMMGTSTPRSFQSEGNLKIINIW